MKAFIQLRCSGRGLPERGALGSGDAITFRIQVPSHLHSVAGFPLLYVLVHCRLQQVGILALGLPDSHYTLICGLDKHGRVGCLHVGPHLLKHSDLRPLTDRIVNVRGKRDNVSVNVLLSVFIFYDAVLRINI